MGRDSLHRQAQRRGFLLSIATVLLGVMLAACSAVQHTAPGTRAGSRAATLSQSRSAAAVAPPCTPVSNAIQQVEASVVRIETPPDAQGEASAGTGFVVDTDLVLTNQHVVAGVTRVTATFINGRPAVGRVMATNEAQDLALILVDTTGVPSIVWGDDRTLKAGSPLAAIGYAQDLPGPPSRSVGTFQRTYVDPSTGQAYLLSDLLLDHGDSGGPLLNQCGQVVGINTAKIRGEQRAGLAIPEFLAHRWATEQIQMLK